MSHDVTYKQQYYEICPTCDDGFYYTEDDVWFDEQSCGFSVKLVKCPRCGGISRIKYYEDKNLDVNNDERFYDYRRYNRRYNLNK